jgi:hypothetical protein
LAWLCLAFLLTAALSQLKPCLPNWSTLVLPQIQGCGRQIGAPILRAHAILKLELFSFNVELGSKEVVKFLYPAVAQLLLDKEVLSRCLYGDGEAFIPNHGTLL